MKTKRRELAFDLTLPLNHEGVCSLSVPLVKVDTQKLFLSSLRVSYKGFVIFYDG